MLLTSDQINSFATDGAVVVRGAFNEAQVAQVAAGIEANLLDPGPLMLVASSPDDPGYFVEDFCNWQRISQYEDFIRSSPAAVIAQQLMQSQQVRLHHDHMLVKEAGTKQRTPWHQDQPYYNIAGFQNVSMWMPVDSVPRQSSVEFLAGSHLGPWLMPRTFQDNQAKWFPEGTLADLPDVEEDRDSYRILGWALEPGDAVFFHMLTLHGAAGSSARRRAFSVRFIGDDARHAARPWRTSPEFAGLAAELPDGAPFEHPLFPVLVS
ncbi:MAG: phytanoyl-CoA dioxygenase family protein [Actinomycetota bacterium]|nr:phytanoyl-CoA dioxygenase family protein [Actinomycetota bacterium]